MNITVLLSIPGRIRQVGTRNTKSRAGEQNILGSRSRVDRIRKISRIDRVTRAKVTRTKRRDKGRIVERRQVNVGVIEVNRTTDIRKKSNGRHGVKAQNSRILPRIMVSFLNPIVS